MKVKMMVWRGWRRETGLSPPVKYFTDRSKAELLLWIFHVFFCFVFVMPLVANHHQTETPECAGGLTKINSDCDQFQI